MGRRYIINGRVQGVGFRYFAEEAAQREGVRGWVRNLPDRSVEIAAEGEADAMKRFDRAVRNGPPGARVDRVDVSDAYPMAGETEFRIR